MNSINIIVCGKTGVGKSTLINSVLGKEKAKTGISIGSGITKGVEKYSGISSNTNYKFNLYDTEGFELDYKQRKKSIDVIKATIQKALEDEPIHLMWYCINVLGGRYEEKEVELISEIINKFNINCIIVLTQSDNPEKETEIVKKINENIEIKKLINEGKIRGICPVLAKNKKISLNKKNLIVDTKGIKELEDKSYSQNAIATVNSFVHKLNIIEQKAQKYAKSFIITSIITGVSPIPFSDSAILIPLQVTMLKGINKIFDFEIHENSLKNIANIVLKTTGASLIGKTIVGNTLKFIPGIGSLAGGVISGGVAGAITTTLAKSYISQLKKLKLTQFYNAIEIDALSIENFVKQLKI